ncbi:MAG: phosphoglycerate dehydrogenase [Planctomycetota bacterium]|nr:phosphoglycerate dehydrogenase [Planctomycetota bacterium]
MSTGTSIRRQAATVNAKVLIADALNDRGVAILKEGGLQVETKTGLNEDQLCAAIAEYDGLIVRSASNVTPKVLEAGKKLQIVGRAGVGVDNIDLKAATALGIVVQNTPFGNITSAGEHAVALLFGCARNLTRADAGMKAGQWPKKGLTGVELTGKNIGVIGMGKVAAIVVRVAKALEMNVLVFDPYLTDRKAEEIAVTKCTVDELCEQADFITIHTPLTPETKGLINAARLSKMKKTTRIVNAARGGIIDEAALAEALAAGQIAGAGLDVFETEPLAADSPLRKQEKLILTPHLGASTEEAQERVAEDIAKQFVEFFRDGVIRNAVNIQITLDARVAPYARLAESMAAMGTQMSDEPVKTLKVGCYGKLAQLDTKEVSLCALKGVLGRTASYPVTLVNAMSIAETRGVELVEHKSEKVQNYANMVVVGLETAAGEHTISGTCFDNQQPRIVRIDDFDIDLRLPERLLLMFYPDQPGMVGKFGTILGESDINIANMAVGRRQKRGQAVVALTLDDQVPDVVIDRIRKAARIDELYYIELKV